MSNTSVKTVFMKGNNISGNTVRYSFELHTTSYKPFFIKFTHSVRFSFEFPLKHQTSSLGRLLRHNQTISRLSLQWNCIGLDQVGARRRVCHERVTRPACLKIFWDRVKLSFLCNLPNSGKRCCLFS